MVITQEFIWWMGVVENIFDPEKLGRVKVRIFGLHNENKEELPISALPWALIMQPTTSAATSGIGSSPVGLVQGAWVVGFFSDGKNMQQPIVMGSIGSGIPMPENNAVVQEPGNASQIVSSTSTSQNNPNKPATSDLSPLTESDKQKLKTYIAIQESNNNYAAESPAKTDLGKYQFTAPALATVGLLKKNGTVNLTDVATDSNWIGTKSGIPKFTGINSKSSFLGSSDAQEKAMDLLLLYNYSSLVKNNLINPNDFTPEKRQRVAGLLSVMHARASTGRKMAREGVFNYFFGKTNLANRYKGAAIAIGASAAATPPAVQPIVPTATTVQETSTRNTPAEISYFDTFKDPSGKYPKKEYYGFSDVNKLASGVNALQIESIKKKFEQRTHNINTADNRSWNEPPTAYCASYPYNQVIETTAGHIVELDNTPGAERIHIFHKKGSYIEIDSNGSFTKKVTGNNYEIIEYENKIYVKNACKLTVDGPTEILLQNHANIIVHGDLNATVLNNINLNTSKNIDITAGENLRIKAKNIKLTAVENIENYAKNKNTTVSETINNRSQNYKLTTASTPHGVFINDASNPALSISSNMLGVPPLPKEVASYSESILRNVDCIFDESGLAENDDGDDEVESEELVTLRTQTVENYVADIVYNFPPDGTKVTPSSSTNKSVTTISPNNCGFSTDDDYSPQKQLSTYFTLGDLTINVALPSCRESIPETPRRLSKPQIACNLKMLAINCLDKIKEHYPTMVITNAFRKDYDPSDPTTKKIRGSKSDHGIGQAADLQFSGIISEDELINIAKWISENVPYKQVIYEYNALAQNPWIHIAFGISGDTLETAKGVKIGTLYINTQGKKQWISKDSFVKVKK